MMLRKSGFSLIEVLVTLVVLSIGLIALGAMNLLSLRAAQSSYNVSIASSIALDIEERLWILAAQEDGRCIEDGDVRAMLTEAADDWEARVGKVGLDGLNIEEDGGIDIHPSNYWKQVSFAVTWTDGRFDDQEESFPYTARVICAPPADDNGGSDGSNGNDENGE